MPLTRRAFHLTTASASLAGLGRVWAGQSPAIITSDRARPAIAHGVSSGDVDSSSAVVWSRTDRPARMIVEYATNEAFRDPRRVLGPAALGVTDFTAKTILTGLPAGEPIFYRVLFEDLSEPGLLSLPTTGRFRTASTEPRPIRLIWGGDVVGQGYGIDLNRGGMKAFETMRSLNPDVFIHSGDTIYADNPLVAELKLDDGSTWKNVTTEAKSKVAETLAEYWGNHRYNLLDDNVRRFNAEVAQLVQWDDHETLNNWYPGEMLTTDARYEVKSVSLLAARAKRAFFDYTPTRTQPDDPERIFRKVSYGPLLDVFLLDQRTDRGPNTANRQPQADATTAFMGRVQLDWLKAGLKASKATWKILASDMPIGIVVGDGPGQYENAANGDDGPPLGRELEFAELFGFLKANTIKNTVWLTADVHYAAAHHYDPARAKFTDFDPFWEFVAGPLHAGTFGPGTLDGTFGPEAKFISIPKGMKPNRPPSEGYQFFGTVDLDPKTKAMTVGLWNVAGKRLYSIELPPELSS